MNNELHPNSNNNSKVAANETKSSASDTDRSRVSTSSAYAPRVHQSKRPVRPSERPMRPSERPVRQSERPVRQSERPVRPSERPVRPKQCHSPSYPPPPSNKHFIILVLSVIVIALLTVVIIMATTLGNSSQNNSNINNDINNNNNNNSTQDTPTSTSSPALLPESADMGQEYIDSLVFVGDSNTAHLSSFEILKGGRDTDQVWIPEGYTLALDSQITQKKVKYPETEEMLTIPQAAAKKKPEYLVISLGTNGVSYLSEEQFKYCYKKLIDAVKEASPSTKIMVQSIYPVTSTYEYFSNETINTANKWLLELAEECDIKYLDTASVLKDETGAMRAECNSGYADGYHINKEAALEVLKYIRTHAWVD